MPAKSRQQMKYIYAMRHKYGTKKKAPKNMKWVFDEDWTKNIKFKDLPHKVKESYLLKFDEYINENLSNYDIIPDGEYKGFIKGWEIYSDEIDSGFKSYDKGLKNIFPIKCKITCINGLCKAESEAGNFYNSEESDRYFTNVYGNWDLANASDISELLDFLEKKNIYHKYDRFQNKLNIEIETSDFNLQKLLFNMLHQVDSIPNINDRSEDDCIIITPIKYY